MTSAAATITVTVAPHWVNALLLRPAARPVIQVDDEDHVARWGKPLTVAVSPGHHRIRAFFRYRGAQARLGATQREVQMAAGDVWRFVLRHGSTKHSGLRFVQVVRV